jgi:hypothetical protein
LLNKQIESVICVSSVSMTNFGVHFLSVFFYLFTLHRVCVVDANDLRIMTWSTWLRIAFQFEAIIYSAKYIYFLIYERVDTHGWWAHELIWSKYWLDSKNVIVLKYWLKWLLVLYKNNAVGILHIYLIVCKYEIMTCWLWV